MSVLASTLSLVEFPNKNRQLVLKQKLREQTAQKPRAGSCCMSLLSPHGLSLSIVCTYALPACNAVIDLIKQFRVLFNRLTQLITYFRKSPCESAIFC